MPGWLRRILERIDGWFDVDLGNLDDDPACWICDDPAVMRDVLGMEWCAPCWDNLDDLAV